MKTIPVRDIASQQELGASESFNIRNVKKLLAGEDMIQPLHRHSFYYVLALEKGSGVHVIDFTHYDIEDQSLFFMRPGQVHELALRAGSSGYLMEFKADLFQSHDRSLKELVQKIGNTVFYKFDPEKSKKIFSSLADIFDEFSEKQMSYQEAIKAKLSILFIELIRQADTKSTTSPVSYAQERLEHFIELLEKNVTTRKQASDYAEMLNLSGYQLNAITKSLLGKTCSAVINEYAILESKRYLLASSSQISDIACHLGYDDVSYFIRFFRKHTGSSPEAFRKNFK